METEMSDEEALRLHDRMACGMPLTEEESVQLEAWYATQDAAEARGLASTGSMKGDLTGRIQESLERVAEATRHIQKTMTDNDVLRGEIASLRLELARQAARS